MLGTGPATDLSVQTATLTYSASTTTITLTVSVSLRSNTPPGSDYTITIKATDGSTTHQAGMTVAATTAPGATPLSTAGLTLIYIITGILAAPVASGLAVLVITRHRKTTPK